MSGQYKTVKIISFIMPQKNEKTIQYIGHEDQKYNNFTWIISFLTLYLSPLSFSSLKRNSTRDLYITPKAVCLTDRFPFLCKQEEEGT